VLAGGDETRHRREGACIAPAVPAAVLIFGDDVSRRVAATPDRTARSSRPVDQRRSDGASGAVHLPQSDRELSRAAARRW